MKIVLYSMTSDKRKIGKTKAKLFELENVIIKQSTSAIEPTFVVTKQKGKNIPSMYRVNYLYSYATKKYYFVSDIRWVTGSCLELICVEDVLESYKNEIRNITTLIERQENVYSPYIVDDELRVSTANRNTGIARVLDKYSVGALGNNFSFIITTVGGA